MEKSEARAQILLSASGDFVSIAEAAGFVRDDRPESTAEVVRSETLAAVAELLRSGLIQVGTLNPDFAPWQTPCEEWVAGIEQAWDHPDYPPLPWDGIWIANTTAGDRLADELADDGKVTRRER